MADEATLRFFGLDLAWSERNLTGACVLEEEGSILDEQLLSSDDEIVAWVGEHLAEGVDAVAAIDAPLLVPNEAGRRQCESEVSKAYGARKASPHSSNRKLLTESNGRIRGEDLVERLEVLGFGDPWHGGPRTVLEVYPHPAIVEVFGLEERLKYKKGHVGERRQGLRQLSLLLSQLEDADPRLVGPAVEIHEEDKGSTLRSIEDRLDARMCAWIAAVWHRRPETVHLFGDGDSGHIAVPIGRFEAANSNPAVMQRITEKARVVLRTAGAAAAQLTAGAGHRVAELSAATVNRARRLIDQDDRDGSIREAFVERFSSDDELAEGIDLPQAGALLAAQFLLADFIASRERDEKRRERMEAVVAKQRQTLVEASAEATDAPAILASYSKGLEAVEQIGLMVDLYFLDPFAPYTIRFSRTSRKNGLELLAQLISDDDTIVDQIGGARRDALAAHSKRSLGRIGLIGLAAAAALGAVGFLAAPMVGAAIGAGAGLAGAAAVSHGLAILGGGALAAGGAGMAGGMWVVAGAGAAAGAIAAGGGTALYQLGSATARGELVKLQITFKLGLLNANRDMAKAQEAITGLVAQADATRQILAEERKLNDENSKRLKDLEETLADIEQAIGWMESERDAAEAAR